MVVPTNKKKPNILIYWFDAWRKCYPHPCVEQVMDAMDTMDVIDS
jgi:hypothetical protein